MSFLKTQLKILFKDVYIVKPRSSRMSSTEAFVIGLDFHKPECYSDMRLELFTKEGGGEIKKIIEEKKDGNHEFAEMVPYMTIGDLSGYD